MTISKNKLKFVYIISSIIVVAILVYWYFSNLNFTSNHPFEHRFFQSIIIISTRTSATISVLYLAYLYKPATKVGKFWLFLGLGLLSKTIGEVLYQYFLVFTDIPAFPSIADIFFLAAYPFWYIAFYIQIKLISVKLLLSEKIIVFGIFITLCVFTFIMVIILPIYELYPLSSLDIFLLVMGASYPLCDLVLLISILILFTKLRKGKMEITWILILLGFLIYLIANIIFNWFWAVVQIVMGYAIFDALISIGHIFILNGALTVISLMKTEFEHLNNN